LAELKAVQTVRTRSQGVVKVKPHSGALSDEKVRELEVAVERAWEQRIAYSQYIDTVKLRSSTQPAGDQ
jgi:hypothetical protein